MQPNALLDSRDEALAVPRGDLVLAFCSGCGLIWNVAFDPDALEYDEGYENSLHFSPTFQRYAEELAERLVERYAIRNQTVVEIGSGKGEFLALVCAEGGNRGIGFDPSYDGESDDVAPSGVDFVRELYPPASAPPVADLLVGRHVLEHIVDPVPFLASVRRAATSPSTVLYFEVPAAEHLLRTHAVWDPIYPHVCIYSEAALRGLFERTGFRVLRTGFSFGDQYLWIEASPTRTPPSRAGGHASKLAPLVSSFSKALELHRQRWSERLAAGGVPSVAVWGAGAKGTTFLNLVEGGDRVGHVVDVNPRKRGKHVPGTGQPISAPEDLAERPPRHVVVMNPIYRAEIRQTLHGLGIEAEIEAV